MQLDYDSTLLPYHTSYPASLLPLTHIYKRRMALISLSFRPFESIHRAL